MALPETRKSPLFAIWTDSVSEKMFGLRPSRSKTTGPFSVGWVVIAVIASSRLACLYGLSFASFFFSSALWFFGPSLLAPFRASVHYYGLRLLQGSDYRKMLLFGPENRRERNCTVEGDESPGVVYCQGKQVNVVYLFGSVDVRVIDESLIQNA